MILGCTHLHNCHHNNTQTHRNMHLLHLKKWYLQHDNSPSHHWCFGHQMSYHLGMVYMCLNLPINNTPPNTQLLVCLDCMYRKPSTLQQIHQVLSPYNTGMYVYHRQNTLQPLSHKSAFVHCYNNVHM